MIIFVVVFLLFSVGYRTIELKKQSNALMEKEATLERRILEEEKKAEELAALEKYMKTKKFIEETAKEKLGLVYPNEILIEPSNK